MAVVHEDGGEGAGAAEVPPGLAERIAAIGVADPVQFCTRPVPAFSGRTVLEVLRDEDGPERVDAHLATVAAVLGTGDAPAATSSRAAGAVPSGPRHLGSAARPRPEAGVTWQLLLGSAVAIALAVTVLLVVRNRNAELASKGSGLVQQVAPAGRPEDAAAFVTASERNRRATWFVVEEFTRSAGGTVVLRDRTTRAQRGLDASLVIGGGNLQLIVGDNETGCGKDPADAQRLRCRPGPNLRANRQAQLDQDLDAIRQLLLGAAPLYAVTVPRPDCFELRLRQSGALAPPYGSRATICFDRESGAQVSSEIEKDGGIGRPTFVDATTTLEVRATVTDADLALPANATLEP